MGEDEVAGFRVSFLQDGAWVEAPGFRKYFLLEDVTRPDVATRRLPGLQKFSNITLKRGSTARSGSLAGWEKDADGRYVRKDLRVELVDSSGKPVHTYSFKQGWPIKWAGGPLKADGNEVAMEELVLTYEGLEIT